MLIFDILTNPSRLFSSVEPGIAEGVLGLIAFVAGILIAISLHETAHAFAALKCGDETAKRFGRVTINPLKHLDPLGTMMLLIVGFGWAKPVPVNPDNFNKPRRDNFIVSAAGIVVNLLTAFVATAIILLLELLANSNGAVFVDNRFLYLLFYLFYLFFTYLMIISVGLALFNLLPFYPLDGFHLLESLAGTQNKFVIFMRQYSGMLIIALIALSYIPFLVSPLSWYVTTVRGAIVSVFKAFWGLFGL